MKNVKHPEIEKKCDTAGPLPVLKMGKGLLILDMGNIEDGK